MPVTKNLASIKKTQKRTDGAQCDTAHESVIMGDLCVVKEVQWWSQGEV